MTAQLEEIVVTDIEKTYEPSEEYDLDKRLEEGHADVLGVDDLIEEATTKLNTDIKDLPSSIQETVNTLRNDAEAVLQRLADKVKEDENAIMTPDEAKEFSNATFVLGNVNEIETQKSLLAFITELKNQGITRSMASNVDRITRELKKLRGTLRTYGLTNINFDETLNVLAHSPVSKGRTGQLMSLYFFIRYCNFAKTTGDLRSMVIYMSLTASIITGGILSNTQTKLASDIESIFKQN